MERPLIRSAWIVLLALLMLGAVSPRVGAQPPKGDEVAAISLKYISAKEAETLLAELIGAPSGGPRIVANARTNSLLVTGKAGDQVMVRALLTKIDVPQKDGGGGVLKIFTLEHATADDQLRDMLKTVLNPGGRIAVDPRRNAVLIHGDPRTLEVVEALLRALDRPKEGPAALPNFQVRLMWLGSGKVPPGADPVPADLKDVVARLEGLGAAPSGMFAQLVVPAQVGGTFTIKGTTTTGPSWALFAEGELTVRDAKMHLAIRLQANEVRDKGAPASLCDLSTQITLSPGQTVLLGVTPTKQLTSVFALQVVSEGARKRP